jgi:hypothetical protein
LEGQHDLLFEWRLGRLGRRNSAGRAVCEPLFIVFMAKLKTVVGSPKRLAALVKLTCSATASRVLSSAGIIDT